MSRIKFLSETVVLASRVPQFRGSWKKDMIMDRELNELVELGSVSADTAGEVPFGIEAGGKLLETGLRQD